MTDDELKAAVRSCFPTEKHNLERLEATGISGVVKQRASLIRRIVEGRLTRPLQPKERAVLAEFTEFGAKAILSSSAQRGGDFLNNQLRGRWAEQVVLSLDLQSLKIVAFGPSSAAMPGQEDYRRVVTTYGEIELLEGKRPDLLAFDRNIWDQLSAEEQRRVETWPERLLEAEDLAIVSQARFGIEVKNSTWHFATRRERHADLSEETEAPAGDEVTPPAGRLSITVKQEELVKIIGWMQRSGKPVLFFQVLFDEIYCMSFSRMVEAIGNGQLYEAGDYVARVERRSAKLVHFFFLASTLHRCARVSFPNQSIAHVKIMASGSVIPYIEFVPAATSDPQPTVIEDEAKVAEDALQQGLPVIETPDTEG